MATQIFNNDSKPYLSVFRGRKAARRSKPPKGITIKKPNILLQSATNDVAFKKPRVCYGKDAFPDCVSVDEYKSLGKISSGSYGVVYKVEHKRTGEIMAMKEEFNGLSPSTRAEIDILKSLAGHPCIVRFEEVAVDEYDGVYVVMEYMETDLRRYMSLKGDHDHGLAISQVKKLMKQLIQGVEFLHRNKVLHRDLKPANVLVSKGGQLKICDFGLSIRVEDEDEEEECKVGRCGESEEDQLHEMYCILGHPSAKKNVESSICGANLMLSGDGFDLLKGLLCYDPVKRMTAGMALNHAWFEDEITSGFC
ncbi:cyclin-dependent kinase G-1-like [Salvia hispanica]|uniref:cyclin-dependent kinase G-1-like n=1 Tax=Salvia hispanica TaxID=49212 RepID=UPI0020090508|nr:cyclin-dependent kinase G-1-like [Salvia hispanica]